MNKFFIKTFVFLLVIIGFCISPLLAQRAKAQLSDAECGINVSVSGRTVTVTGFVREGNPGIDPSDVSVSISDNAPGNGINKSESLHDDSITTVQTAYDFPIGIWVAYVEGESFSNPGGGSSSCEDEYLFTVQGDTMWELEVSKTGNGSGYVYSSNVGGIDCGGDCNENYNEGTWVTLEADPSSGSTFTGWGGECSGTGSCTFNMGGNRYVTANFTANQTAPGSFSLTGTTCFGWPSPRVETNFYESSGATSYTLQKWFGSYWGDIYTGSYYDLDQYGDSNISMGTTYYYQVVAHGGGDTVSNNYTSVTPTPSDCGQVLYELSAYVASGSGKIVGAGLDCPGVCSVNIESGNPAQPTASGSNGYTFSSWNGACAGQGSVCSLVMNGNKSISANFSANSYILYVSKEGAGSGTVTSTSHGGISCGSDCSEPYSYPTPVVLTRSESTGSSFAGWSGACSGMGTTCTVTMDNVKYVTATFSLNNVPLTVSKSGSGTGVVTSISHGGISCGSDCYEEYPYGTTVILRGSSSDSSLSGWSGDCAGTGDCTVNLTQARYVTAIFNLNSYLLTTQISEGFGTINATGISCSNAGGGSDCSEPYSYGNVVTLTPTDAANYDFHHWSGDCTGNGSCQVTMNSNKTVGAHFWVVPFNYSLSNSGPSNVTKSSGNAFTQNTITKTLTAGVTQSVDLSLSGVPSGTTYSISNKTCSPTCSSTITFTVGPTTPTGTHNITVSGSLLGKTTNFNLVVTGAPISVTCSGAPATVFLNQTVNWTSTVGGGRAPFTYAWSGTAIPTSPAPNSSSYSRSYSTIGQKTAQLTVTDVDGTQSTCPAATVQVNFDPNFEEF